MSIANEIELLSSIMTGFPPARNALVIAPHPDDEVFGCGGTMSLLRRGGTTVTIIIVTNGAQNGDNTVGNLVEIRAEESRSAAKVLGLDAPIFWGLPDREVKYGEVLIGRLVEAILETTADLVFIPSPTEWHPDHQAIAFAGAEAVRRLGGKRQAAFYEVGAPLPSPNLIHDITSADELKRQAMRCFRSQLQEQPYDTRVSGMNSFRALNLGAQAKCAEAFTLLAATDLDKGLPILLDGPLASRRNLGFAAAASDIPLVSVIIRSMDRPTLMDALDSLALQTYSNIEVVLVNARGADHRTVEECCGRFPIRMIGNGAPISRSRAANMGLEAAHGEYLMFLDDDDWFDADHIQKLTAAIRQHPEFKVAYTGVKCVDERKNPLAKTFEAPFDAGQMVAANFIPIHAALFSRDLLALDCRLDESLDLYEDWDFWIQLSRHSDFLHVDGLSAIYRITQQTGFGVKADPVVAERGTWLVHNKWFDRLDDRQISGLVQAVLHSRAKDDQISRHRKVAAEQDRTIVALGQTVESLVIDRDSRTAAVVQLQAALEILARERHEQVAQFSRTVESLVIDRESRNAAVKQLQDALESLARERDEQAVQFDRAIAERDEKALQLNRTIAERDEQALRFTRTIAERDGQVGNLRSDLSALYGSTSWRLTSPLRTLAGGIKKGIRYVSRRNRHPSPPAYLSLDGEYAGTVKPPVVTTHERGDGRFRILLVSHYYPSRAHAGGLRILDIYALIRQHCPNVQLDLLTHHRPNIDWSLDDAQRIFDNVFLSPTEHLTPDGLAALRGSPLSYAVIDLQFHQTGYQIDAFRQIGGKIIFTPMESLAKVLFIDMRTKFLMKNGLQLFKAATPLRLAAEEIGFALKVDDVVCVSRADAAFLRAVTSSRRIHGVDTGVSQFEFAEALAPGFTSIKAADRPCRVLYVAYFGSETNVVALLWYLEHVHPLIKAEVPGYMLTVVGRGDMSPFAKYHDKSIEFVGEVPALAPYIQQARVGIAPALGGSGLRGKINQYAVMGVPCVVSPIAFRGLSYQEGTSIFIAETPEIFADRCIRLLTDLDLNDRMGQAARTHCLEHYSWQSRWQSIRKIYQLERVA